MTAPPPPVSSPAPRRGLLADVLDPYAFRVALYVLLALPAGGLVVGLLTVGVVGGVLTLALVVGAALLLGALWLVGGLADVQRVLAGLLGVTFVRAGPPPAYTGVWAWVRATLSDPATYRALLFHVVQFPLAALCWLVLGSLLLLTLGALASPLWWLYPPLFPLVWQDSTVTPGLPVVAGLLVLGLGSLLVLGGVLNLMGRMWTRLTLALLGGDMGYEAARREVMALRRAAGRVALGDDLDATLADLAVQARLASTAQAVALLAPDGTARASSGTAPAEWLLPNQSAPVPQGEADVRYTAGGATLVSFPVSLPPSAEVLDGGMLQAVYTPGTRPGPDELAFLLSIADHAGTALHAAQLIERAGTRAGEQERARLARELHDSVAQALYGITLGAKTARATLDRDTGKARASLDYTIRLAEGGVSEMKALLFSLRPDALEEGGLVAALTGHAQAMEARHGLTVFADLPAEPHLTPDAQAAAYRVAQEALHNVVKHARAHQVWLSVQQAGGWVTLTVRDDGRGFDPEQQGRGTLGQRSMRERAAGAGGTLEVRSVRAAQVGIPSGTESGTTVTLRLPAAPAEPQPVAMSTGAQS
ncbi:sensor histidine kinase [Deinococcus sp. Arct2-2]|uniref:sensor histidine kinase n=1 Tax=Deinococcus sp. Arct2-2 TaxID=2568653 RepID=UPI0010A3B46E|nr:sensor histidine kinase [Deinococcus sp. Arct2-2]THF68240.1 sensor histidine kinase [Deinococcus sp. Arct2-2]